MRPFVTLSLMLCLLTLPAVASAEARQISCQGTFLGAPASISGVRQAVQYDASGGVEIAFEGVLQTNSVRAQMYYGGYQRVGLQGYLTASAGSTMITVLDNGGQLSIYTGGAGRQAPELLGQFSCR